MAIVLDHRSTATSSTGNWRPNPWLYVNNCKGKLTEARFWFSWWVVPIEFPYTTCFGSTLHLHTFVGMKSCLVYEGITYFWTSEMYKWSKRVKNGQGLCSCSVLDHILHLWKKYVHVDLYFYNEIMAGRNCKDSNITWFWPGLLLTKITSPYWYTRVAPSVNCSDGMSVPYSYVVWSQLTASGQFAKIKKRLKIMQHHDCALHH